jgi:hypothetical protein
MDLKSLQTTINLQEKLYCSGGSVQMVNFLEFSLLAGALVGMPKIGEIELPGHHVFSIGGAHQLEQEIHAFPRICKINYYTSCSRSRGNTFIDCSS